MKISYAGMARKENCADKRADGEKEYKCPDQNAGGLWPEVWPAMDNYEINL